MGEAKQLPEIQNNSDLEPSCPTLSISPLLPVDLARRVEDARFEAPELFDISEHDLRAKISKLTRERNQHGICSTLNQVRLRLWLEFENCHLQGHTRIDLKRVLTSVTTYATFKNMTKNNWALAWLMCAPTKYMNHINELIDFGSFRMRQILSIDPVDPITGKVDTKLVNLQNSIYKDAVLRQYGAIAQVTKNLNVNVGGNGTTVEGIEALGDEAIKRRIEDMQLRRKTLKATKTVKDDDAIDV